MRVLLYTYGTRGDVEPYVALAWALNTAGHDATLAAPAAFAALAAAHGVRFVPRHNGFLELMDDPRYRRAIENHGVRKPDGRERERQRAELQPLADRMREQIFPAMLESLATAAAGGADLVVHKGEHAQHVAEKLGVPSVLAVLHPFAVPSRYYPASPTLLSARPASLANRFSHYRSRLRGVAPTTRAAVERWRAETLGLPPRRGMHDSHRQPNGDPVPVLHGFSRYLAAPAPDWPDRVRTTGYWYLPRAEDWSPPPALDRFLAAGPPPVVFGFGSLAGSDPRRAGLLVRETVARTGIRAVVVSAGGSIDIPEPDEHLLVLDQVPYGWLFPRCRAVVHAGGLGTTQYALAAGLPQVACPLQPEQMAWGHFLHRLGVAPAPTWQRDLTAETLTAAVRAAVTDPAKAAAARRLGPRVRAEPGVDQAVQILEEVYAGHARSAGRGRARRRKATVHADKR